MKKRLLSILCVLALCLTMLPVTALAAETPATNVTVCGAELDCTSGNTVYAIANDTDVQIVTGSPSEDDWNIKFESGTLTLRDATIKVPMFNYGIYCASGSLKILLEGVSTIQYSDDGYQGIYCESESTLMIQGTGENASLAFSGFHDIGYGIQSNGGCVIQNVMLTSSDSAPAFELISCGQTLEISDSTIQVDGSNGVFSASETAEVTRSTITLTGQDDNNASEAAMWAYHDLTLTDTTVEMERLLVSEFGSAVKSASGDVTLSGKTSITIGETLQPDMQYAVYAAGALTIPDNAEVTLSTGLNYGLYAGGNLTIGQADVNVSTAGAALYSGADSIRIGETAYQNTGLQELSSVTITDGAITGQGRAYDIWVGGVRVTDANASDVLGDGKVRYDAAANTLTLDNAEITGIYNDNVAGSTCIYAEGDLKLELVGENKVTSTGDTDDKVHGVYVIGNLDISGGSLTAAISGGNAFSNAVYVNLGLTITDDTVIATSEPPGHAASIGYILVDGVEYQVEEDATRFSVENGVVTSGAHLKGADILYVNGMNMLDSSAAKPEGVSYDAATNTLTLTNASITKDYHGFGIESEGPLTINLVGNTTVKSEAGPFECGVYLWGTVRVTGSGSLTAHGDGYGIYVSENFTVQGGSVTGTSTGDGSDGIRVYGTLTVRGGAVTGNGTAAAIVVASDQSVKADELIVLPEGYVPAGYELQTLDMGDGFTRASIVPAGGTLSEDRPGSLTGAAKSIALKAGQSTDPGGSTGGGSSGGGSSSGSTTETTQNPDGSTTTTVTKPDGSTTETTKRPDGSQEVVNTDKEGNVTTTTTDKDGNKTETVEKTDGSSQTTVINKDGSGSTTTSQDGRMEARVKLTAAVVDSAAEKGETVKLPMPAIPVTSDKENAPTVTAELPAGQSVKVEIPVENPTAGTVAVRVKADDSEEIIKTSVTSETGVVVTIQDGDKVKIVDNSTEFTDVPDTYWGAEAIDFVSSRELMNGVGDKLFAPGHKLTRGQLCQLLYNLEDAPASGDSAFTDVADGAWFADAVDWAAFQGIVSGYGNGAFGPNDPITREQLTVMLYRYAQLKGYDVRVGEDTNILSYTDAQAISEYAVSAMQWACGAGIIKGTGDGSMLSPLGDATRAEVATMLMRFCVNVTEAG